MKKISTKKIQKKGFTMVELIAVMAIIAILSISIAPRVVGYINEAKKTKALAQVREVIMAVDSYNVKASTEIKDDATYQKIAALVGGTGDTDDYYIDTSKITAIDNSLKLSDMKSLVNGDKTFNLSDQGKIAIVEAQQNNE